MNDYLRRLIARSIGASEPIRDMIRPRVPSLFEPAGMAPPSVEVSFECRRPGSAPDPSRAFNNPERGPASIGRPVSSSIISEHRGVSGREETMPDEPAFLYRGNLRHAVQSNVHASTPPNAIDAPVGRHAEPSYDPKTGIPTIPHDGAIFSRIPSSESVRPNIQAPSVSDERQDSRAEAPVVRVTIGRIDVRAVMPAPEMRRPVKGSAPKLSLDDYLAQRRTRRA